MDAGGAAADDDDWVMNGGAPGAGEPQYSYRAACGDDTDDEIEHINAWVREQRGAGPADTEAEAEWGGPAEAVDLDCGFEMAVRRTGQSRQRGARRRGGAGGGIGRRRRNRCWGCHYGLLAGEAATSSAAMKGLVRLIRENHGKMADGELSLIVSEYHSSEIQVPAVDAGLLCDEWTPQQVLRHLRTHTLDPRIVIGENIATLRCLIRETRKKLIKKNDDSGEEQVDPKTVDILLKTMKMLMDMYGKRPDDLLFGQNSVPGDDTTDDFVVSQRRALAN